MRTVKTKKELIKAIEDGERNIKVDSKSLYVACKLAETYDSISSLLKHYVISKTTDVFLSSSAALCGGHVVAITISVLVAAISIIAILKDKKAKIQVDKDGTVVVEIG